MGEKTVYLVVIDGGSDWVAATDMVKQKYSWVQFLHCVTHEASLIVKDICKIDEVSHLLTWVTDAQNWCVLNAPSRSPIKKFLSGALWLYKRFHLAVRNTLGREVAKNSNGFTP